MNTNDRITEIEHTVKLRRGDNIDLATRLEVLHEIRDEWLRMILVPEDMSMYLIAIEIMISKTNYGLQFAKQ